MTSPMNGLISLQATIEKESFLLKSCVHNPLDKLTLQLVLGLKVSTVGPFKDAS